MIDARFADKSFMQCKEDVSYCRWFRDATDGSLEIEDGDPQLMLVFFDGLYKRHF